MKQEGGSENLRTILVHCDYGRFEAATLLDCTKAA